MNDIVKMSIKDINEIYAFESLCFPEGYTSMEIWTELLDDERTSVYAIKDKNELIAFASTYNWKGQHDYIKIMCLATHIDYRQMGNASRLMQHIIDESLKEGMYIFKAETRESNRKMQNVFNRFGYELAQRVEGYYDNPKETAYKYALFCQ